MHVVPIPQEARPARFPSAPDGLSDWWSHRADTTTGCSWRSLIATPDRAPRLIGFAAEPGAVVQPTPGRTRTPLLPHTGAAGRTSEALSPRLQHQISTFPTPTPWPPPILDMLLAIGARSPIKGPPPPAFSTKSAHIRLNRRSRFSHGPLLVTSARASCTAARGLHSVTYPPDVLGPTIRMSYSPWRRARPMHLARYQRHDHLPLNASPPAPSWTPPAQTTRSLVHEPGPTLPTAPSDQPPLLS